MQFKNIVISSNEFLNSEKSLTFFKQFKENLSSKINLFLVSGNLKEDVFSLIKKQKLDFIFNEENVYFVSENYLNSLNEIDRKIRCEKYKLNKNYFDEYFKVYFLNNIRKDLNNNDTLFIGKDIWNDAYYLTEHTKVNVLLVKDFLSFNKKEYKKELKTLHTIDFDFNKLNDFLSSNKEFNYSTLKSFSKNYLMSNIVGKLNLNIDYKKLYEKK